MFMKYVNVYENSSTASGVVPFGQKNGRTDRQRGMTKL